MAFIFIRLHIYFEIQESFKEKQYSRIKDFWELHLILNSYETQGIHGFRGGHFRIMSYEIANINLYLVFQIENYFP